jgi:hypothetical protein
MSQPEPDEQAMVLIWREEFGVDTLEAEDNFFVLGGSSFLAAAIAARVATATAVPVTFDAVFEHPTVRQLCAYIRSRGQPVSPR